MHFLLLATWPDSVDLAATIGFFVLALSLPLLGYVFMVADFRAYLRTLNRMLVQVINYLPQIPEWARHETPRCLIALGLKLPCTEEELMTRYRALVKQLHPDRGGDRKKFMLLQRHFEEALQFLRTLADKSTEVNASDA